MGQSGHQKLPLLSDQLFCGGCDCDRFADVAQSNANDIGHISVRRHHCHIGHNQSNGNPRPAKAQQMYGLHWMVVRNNGRCKHCARTLSVRIVHIRAVDGVVAILSGICACIVTAA